MSNTNLKNLEIYELIQSLSTTRNALHEMMNEFIDEDLVLDKEKQVKYSLLLKNMTYNLVIVINNLITKFPEEHEKMYSEEIDDG